MRPGFLYFAYVRESKNGLPLVYLSTHMFILILKHVSYSPRRVHSSSPLFLNQENEPPSKEDPSESRKVTWCRNGVLVPRHIYIHLTCPYVLLKAFLLAFPDFQGSWVEVEVCQPGKTYLQLRRSLAAAHYVLPRFVQSLRYFWTALFVHGKCSPSRIT